MIDKAQKTRSDKTSVGILLAILVAILVLSSARGRLVSSLINQAYATSSTEVSP